MGGEIDEGRHIGLVRKAALAGSPISFFGVGGCNFASFSPPYRSGRSEKARAKKPREGFGLCFVYQHHDNHDFSGDFSMRNYDSANIRRIERRIV